MNLFSGIEFANKGFLWLLIIIPLMIGWNIWRKNKLQGSLRMSAVKGFSSVKKSKYTSLRHYGIVLRILAFIALILALARPQSAFSWQNSTTEGIDIIIATDISGSMLAEDLKPNRLEAGKQIAIDFIKDRP